MPPWRTHPKRKTYKKQPVADASSVEPSDRGGPSGFHLHTIQYRTYQQEIQIYHFRSNVLSVKAFRHLLIQHPAFGFVDAVIGPDTQLNLLRPDGDELPNNTIEVAYLPLILSQKKQGRAHAYALGFRTINDKSKNKKKDPIIEWFCFDKSIEESILRSWVHQPGTRLIQNVPQVHENNPYLVFNKVATLGKGIDKKGVAGAHQEHVDWHASLSGAHLCSVTLKFQWKRYAKAYAASSKAQRKVELKAALAYYENKHDKEYGNKEGDGDGFETDQVYDTRGFGEDEDMDDTMDAS
jgi:hypothetical protein